MSAPAEVDGPARGGGPRALIPLVVGVCLMLLTACGTRLDRGEIVAGAGGGPVILPHNVVQQPQSQSAGRTRTAATTPARSHSAPREATGPAVVVGGAPSDRAVPAAPAPVTCPAGLEPIVVGQIGTFSGVVAPFTASGRITLAVWAQDINARGGIACHPVKLYSADDGGDPARASALVQEMVTRHRVVALVGSFVALTMAGFRTGIESAMVPAVGGDIASHDWFDSMWMFPQGASVDDQAVGLIRGGVELGREHVAVLYCVEASACAEGERTIRTRAAALAGAAVVYDAPVSITQTDYTAQCLGAKNAHADQLVLAVDGSSMGRIARSCASVGYRPLLTTAGGIISPAQAADPTLRALGLATVTTGAPWMLEDTAGLHNLHQALARYQPHLVPDGASVIAWASGKLFEAAVRNLLQGSPPGAVTSDAVRRGLVGIHHETLDGLIAAVSFRPGARPAVSSGCVFDELLTGSGWTAPHGSSPTCVADARLGYGRVHGPGPPHRAQRG